MKIENQFLTRQIILDVFAFVLLFGFLFIGMSLYHTKQEQTTKYIKDTEIELSNGRKVIMELHETDKGFIIGIEKKENKKLIQLE